MKNHMIVCNALRAAGVVRVDLEVSWRYSNDEGGGSFGLKALHFRDGSKVDAQDLRGSLYWKRDPQSLRSVEVYTPPSEEALKIVAPMLSASVELSEVTHGFEDGKWVRKETPRRFPLLTAQIDRLSRAEESALERIIDTSVGDEDFASDWLARDLCDSLQTEREYNDEGGYYESTVGSGSAFIDVASGEIRSSLRPENSARRGRTWGRVFA